ncbi:MAG: Propanediol utilization protein [Firmicutes bacterium]|nr:Propanediol utilization protein [Bacillota bacterium]
MDEKEVKNIVRKVLCALNSDSNAKENTPAGIPVGVSNHHIHLSATDLETLFGEGHQLKQSKRLKQPGQFAAEEVVTLVGPKGAIRNVRVLGPVRTQTQIEISRTDSFLLGIQAPLRESGNVHASASLLVAGPCGAISLREGGICAARHIHMTPDDARRYGVCDGQKIMVETDGERGVVFKKVVIRVRSDFCLEFHIDTDEANAAGLTNGSFIYMVKP